MPDEQEKTRDEATPPVESLYTEDFARKRARTTKRAFIFGGIAFIVCGILVIHESILAARTGGQVVLGGRVGGLSYPPLIAGPVGVLSVLFGSGFWEA